MQFLLSWIAFFFNNFDKMEEDLKRTEDDLKKNWKYKTTLIFDTEGRPQFFEYERQPHFY